MGEKVRAASATHANRVQPVVIRTRVLRTIPAMVLRAVLEADTVIDGTIGDALDLLFTQAVRRGIVAYETEHAHPIRKGRTR